MLGQLEALDAVKEWPWPGCLVAEMDVAVCLAVVMECPRPGVEVLAVKE